MAINSKIIILTRILCDLLMNEHTHRLVRFSPSLRQRLGNKSAIHGQSRAYLLIADTFRNRTNIQGPFTKLFHTFTE